MVQMAEVPKRGEHTSNRNSTYTQIHDPSRCSYLPSSITTCSLSFLRLQSHLLVVFSAVSAAAVLSPAQTLENQILAAPFDASSSIIL